MSQKEKKLNWTEEAALEITPPERLDYLARNGDYYTRLRVARNNNTSHVLRKRSVCRFTKYGIICKNSKSRGLCIVFKKVGWKKMDKSFFSEDGELQEKRLIPRSMKRHLRKNGNCVKSILALI